MSISSEITSIGENLKKDYQSIANLGADLTNVDKNIENIAELLDGVYDNLPKTEYKEGTEVTLESCLKGKLDYEEDNGKKVVGIGQSSQDSTKGYQLLNLTTSIITNRTNQGTTTEIVNQKVKLTGTCSASSGNRFFTSDDNNKVLFPAGNYTFSTNHQEGISLQFRKTTSGVATLGGTSSFTFTLDVDSYLYNGIIKVTNGATYNEEIYLMLEKGSTAHDWEKYTGGQASPNPSYPQTINSVTGNQDVVVSGKNKLDLSQFNSQTQYGITFTKNDDKSITISGTTTHSITIDVPVSISLKANTSYINSQGNTYTANFYSLSLRKDGVVIASNSVDSGVTSKTFTPTEDIIANAYRIYIANDKEVNTTIYPMIIESTSATTYEPYITPTSYQLSLGDIELNAIGDYKDELIYDVDEDKVYKNEKIGKVVLNGSEDWVSFAYGTNSWRLSNVISTNFNANEVLIMSRKFKGIPQANRDDNYAQIYIETSGTMFTIRNTTYTTKSEVQSSMNGEPLYYVLATPVEIPITDTTLINQVKALYNAHSNNGTTIITSNGNLPMIIKVRANTEGITPTGTKSITQNGTYDVKEYASANVNVSGIIPTGTLSITENGTYNVTNYASASVNVSGESYPPNWSEIGYSTTPQATINGFNYAKTIQQNWDSAITTMYSKYIDDSNLMFFPLVDTSNVTTLFKAFYNCANLQMVAKINTASLNNMNQTFYNCTSIYSVPLFDTGEVTTLNACFSGCAKLVEVPQFDTSHLTTTGLKNTFYNCTSLSDTSLNNIMAMCINATGTGSSYKTLKSCGLTSDQATRCQSLSNYAALINAGWTTGY